MMNLFAVITPATYEEGTEPWMGRVVEALDLKEMRVMKFGEAVPVDRENNLILLFNSHKRARDELVLLKKMNKGKHHEFAQETRKLIREGEAWHPKHK